MSITHYGIILMYQQTDDLPIHKYDLFARDFNFVLHDTTDETLEY